MLYILHLLPSPSESHYHTSETLVSATTLTGQKLAPSYWANIVACVMASQFGIVTALGMKNNVISCVYTILIRSFSFLTEVIFVCSAHRH